MYRCKKVKVTQSFPTLCDLMDHTVHGILQARILEWVAFPFSRGYSQPRDQTQVSYIAGRFFTSCHKGSPQMWEMDHKEDWALKNWCFQPMVLQKTLESPLDSKAINPGPFPKGNQPWIFIGKTDTKAKTSNTLATWCEELTHWKRP